jgi:hypothetical protein
LKCLLPHTFCLLPPSSSSKLSLSITPLAQLFQITSPKLPS